MRKIRTKTSNSLAAINEYDPLSGNNFHPFDSAQGLLFSETNCSELEDGQKYILFYFLKVDKILLSHSCSIPINQS